MFDQPNLNNQNPRNDQSAPMPPQPGIDQKPSSNQSVEDIFAETEKDQSRVSRPTLPGEISQKPVSQPTANESDIFGGKSIWQNKLLVIGLAVLILIILAASGWFIYNYFLTDMSPSQDETDQFPPAGFVPSPVETPIIEEEPSPVEILSLDSDRDGLTDEEEIILGTDPHNFDTDGDGLNDYAEVKIYGTDPLNPDTDGDGYLDGDEVANGYDPLRPGSARLFEVPTQ